jgi:YVTN family beta-propeller protein
MVRFDLATRKIADQLPVGVAPYMPIVVGKKVYVSNWGGDLPADPKAITSSGTPLQVDPRTSIGNHGTVSVLEAERDAWSVKSIVVGGHPSGMACSHDDKFVYVANANSDTVSVIDTATDKVVETIDCKPEAKLPFGSGSNAVALSPNGETLYVANGTNNCVAVVELGSMSGGPPTVGLPRPSKLAGLIPTGWYPGAIVVSGDGKSLAVANVKGHGSLNDKKREAEKGRNSHDHLGSVSLIPVPTEGELKKQTTTVNANNRLGYALAGLEKPRVDAKPVPVPERHGEPSVIEHVFYVIKENRTYDQVFGDMPVGNGDKNLCIFGEEVTPNMHQLAREFVLLDNFYCSGVLSADGHSWVNEAYTTDYLEKMFGQFVRSYPYEGSDPLAFPTTGFLWDNALLHKKTFYNFGEHCKTTFEPKSPKWEDLYADYVNGTNNVKVTVEPNLPSLKPYSHPNYPGFPLNVPDVWRAKLFQQKFAEWEKVGKLPNLIYVFLPADHAEGTRPGSPTPRAMNADGDLALGQIVETISKSKFWAKSCILVTMDDPQNGFDHVDGHRTVGLAISPYTRQKGKVVSTCYNQTGMVKSIELMLGLPPMNQMDLTATPMRDCFTDKPDLTPYTAMKNKIPLNEMNPPLQKLKGPALVFAKKSMKLDFSKEDLADEETYNRILWFSVRGTAPYPKDQK